MEQRKLQPKITTAVENAENKDKDISVPENLALGDEITVPFQNQTANFVQNFSGQYQPIVVQQDKVHIPISAPESIVNRK